MGATHWTPRRPQSKNCPPHSEPVVELGPMQDSSISQEPPQSASIDTHVRWSKSTEMPGRYDVQADDASLQSFVAILGPVAGSRPRQRPRTDGKCHTSLVPRESSPSPHATAEGPRAGRFVRKATSPSSSLSLRLSRNPSLRNQLPGQCRRRVIPGTNHLETRSRICRRLHHDKSTGILIQPGSSARSVSVSRTRTLPAPRLTSRCNRQLTIFRPLLRPQQSRNRAGTSSLLMKSTPPAPVAKPAPEKVAAISPPPAPAKIQEQLPLAAPRPPLPSPKFNSTPAVMTVAAAPIDLVSPSAKVNIDVTIIELLSATTRAGLAHTINPCCGPRQLPDLEGPATHRE